MTDNFTKVLDKEINSFQELLDTIPFKNYPTKSFLKIYKLNYKELHRYITHNRFPIDNAKLLKLTISLGNLIKSLKMDEDMYKQQQSQQSNFTARLNSMATPKHFINSEPMDSQPFYQIKFIKNMLLILKNFDIGHDFKDSSSTTTLNQYQNSPIKLNSTQLLIEKLEININLDTLFIYKTLLTILVIVLKLLKSHYEYVDDDQGSIFLSGSENISADEYNRLLNQILTRINNGLIEPLVKFISEFANTNMTNEFKTLITSL